MILPMKYRNSFLVSPLALLLVTCAVAAAPKAPTAPVAHRAVYAIGLADSGQSSGVTRAEGRMVFEVTGSNCDGYTMSQRLVVRLGGSEGSDRLLDFRVSTYESGDGELYRFISRTYVNDRIVEDVKGLAERTGSGIDVRINNPDEKILQLDKQTLFPSQHLHALLSAAQAQEQFMTVRIYEGAGTGESSDLVSAVIGAPAAPSSEHPILSGVRGWPVTMAYFDTAVPVTNDGEQTPSYQMSFVLYENGVTQDLIMDYGDYKLSGTLSTAEAIDEEVTCPGD